MAEVTLAGVTKRFGTLTAVSNLSFSIADGEFMVLLGPTGAGKTTTLRLVAGLERPDAGRISIGGRDVTTAPPARRHLPFPLHPFPPYPPPSVYPHFALPPPPPHRH